ncbi:MAG TPA: MFS transporter [Thermomicrobiales bacterium]|jgi:MFS family permease|nr:MFS transporter [Thermomicrobiales bacterium]
MRALWSDRRFARFWSAGLVFMLATWSLHTTMLIHVFELTGSPFATGLIPVCAALPGILFGPLAGVVVDRVDRRRVMAICALALAGLLVIVTPVAMTVGAGHVALLFAIIALEAVAVTFFRPAENAVLPRLAGPDRLAPANALNALNDSIGRIAGPAVGSVLLLQVGFAATLVVCAVLFLVPWALLRGLEIPPAIDEPPVPDVITDESWLRGAGRDVAAGWRLVRATPVLAMAVAAWGLFHVADVPLSAVLPAFIIGSLGAGAGGMGSSMPIRGLTGLLGGLLVAAIAGRVAPVRLLAVGLLVYGLSIVTMGLAGSFLVALLVLIPIGPASAAIETGLLTLLQRHSPDAVRGRVFALAGMINGAITVTASLVGGTLAEGIGVPAVVVISGALHVLPLILVAVWLRPALRSRPVADAT